MTRIYEALQNAGRERQAGGPGAVRPSDSVQAQPSSTFANKLLALYQRVETLLDEHPCKVVQFTGAQPGEDSSRIVYEFARFTASRLNRKTLLLTTGGSGYVQQMFADIAKANWESVVAGATSLDEVIHAVGVTGLSVSQFAASDSSVVTVLDSPEFAPAFQSLRERFDWILIDAPWSGASAAPMVLSEVADGVVLVVTAGRTRWQVVKRAMDEIAIHRGTVLGVVLNQCRFYIPGFIYRRLL